MRIAFVVPVHGRHQLAEVCLRQLARTCAEISHDASAVLVGDDDRFRSLAADLGFGWTRSANRPLGRKWNDGIEFACRDGAADFVVPFGSDDVCDPRLFDTLASRDVLCARQSAVVAPDGSEIALLTIGYRGGDGVRVYPRALLEHVGFRPANDELDRAIDGSMSDKLGGYGMQRIRYAYRDLHPLQIVDFKSPSRDQRNSYQGCLDDYADEVRQDVFEALAECYPAEFVDGIRSVYATSGRRRVAA